MCVFLKFKCSEVGQVVGTKGSDIADTTCICDYTEGYAYVTRPSDICNCLSPEDDCSCYEKLCPENQRLSADYECINRNTTSSTKCARVDKPRKVVSTVSAESTELKRSKTEAGYITIRICFTLLMGIFCGFKFLVCKSIINKDFEENFTKTCTEGENICFKHEALEENQKAVWLKDGNEIPNSDKYQIEAAGKFHQLVVSKTTLADEGEYCVRINNDMSRFNLIVQEYFTKAFAPTACIEGESIRFECKVREKRQNARWLKGNTEVGEQDKYCKKTSGERHILVINNIIRDDKGEYTVKIKNCSRRFNLKVQARIGTELVKKDMMIMDPTLDKRLGTKKVYNITGRKGKVIVISNVTFASDSENLCRDSVDFDTSSIQQLFKFMEFESQESQRKFKNLSMQEIVELCETVAKDESYDILVVVILSGGQSCDAMEIYDGNGVKVDKETIFTKIRKSPAFKGKPKVVIYTTYTFDVKTDTELADTHGALKSKIKWPTCNNDDFFVITAVPKIKHGHWIMGTKRHGSYFIQTLVSVFTGQAYKKPFRSLLDEVNNYLQSAMVPSDIESEKGKPTVVAEVKVLEFSDEKELYFLPKKIEQGLRKTENNDVADLLKQKEDHVRITISNKPKVKNSSDETVESKMSYGENGDIYKKLDVDPIVLSEGNAIVNEKKPVGASTCEKGKLEDSKPTDFFKWPDLVHGCSFKKKHFVKATPDQYETILKEGKQVYDMIKDTKKGMVIWISNIACPDKSKGNIEEKRITECRNNCDVDKTNMEQLLKAMGLECRPKDQLRDATGEEITQFVKKRLDEVDKDKTNKYASLLVIMMSWKVECRSDKIYDKDGKVVDRSHLYDIFKKSQHFKEKPKIVIIQSYNFEKESSYDKTDGSRNEMIEAEGPNDDDLFVVSTYPRIEKGPWMVGNNLNGSYFIQAMIHVFKSHSHNKSFLELLQELQQCLQTALVPEIKDGKYDNEGKPTRVADVVLLKYSKRKELFFFPGLMKGKVKLLNDFSSSVKGGPVTQPVDDTIKSTDEIAKDLQKPVSNFSEQNTAQTYEKTDSLPPDNQAATDTKSSLESPIVQISSESKAEQTFPQTYEKSDTVSPGDPAVTQLLVDTGGQLPKD